MSFEDLDAELGLLSALCLGSGSMVDAPLSSTTVLGPLAGRVRAGIAGARGSFTAQELANLLNDFSPEELAAIELRCRRARARLREVVSHIGGPRNAASIVVRRPAAARLATLLQDDVIDMLVLRASDVPRVRV